ncbi:DUF732 domain-containing protein [Streptomyces olivoreticuli]|uniref:DUF732 domain-containing protein n=1 Tax=Streptomyces olivoreticuli TaxID=68246 RepID=UPI0026599343|nr:DUF732 domain-containing protein [Streptomyces olivoreticuli]WKK26857.1 DUF732 domain-containing protein [Streptomyces olivoreticuli]
MKRTATALTAVAIAAASLTACGGGKSDDSKTSATTPPVATSSVPAAPATPKPLASAEAKMGIPPKPDAAAQAKYIAALDAISPAVVNGKPDRAVSRGRDTCGTVHSFPTDHTKQVDITRQRFSGATQFTTTQAEQILTAVQTHLCPKH